MKNAQVILVRDSGVFDGNSIEQSVVNRMIETGVMKLLGMPDAESAWKQLFQPTDIVGLKVNCLGGRGLSSHPEVAAAIVEGVKSAGISEENIVIWERSNRDLKRAGFEINTGKSGVKCFGTDALVNGYETEPSVAGQVGSLFSTILSRHCAAIVNVPVLKDHDIAGVSIGLKNFYGAIHNPNKYHHNNCNPYIADLNTHPYIKDKRRLTVCDALTAQYHGGPSFKPQWAWQFGVILMSLDPVALDAVGADILEKKRLEQGMKSFREVNRHPEYIHTAATYKLGIDDLSRIDIITC